VCGNDDFRAIALAWRQAYLRAESLLEVPYCFGGSGGIRDVGELHCISAQRSRCAAEVNGAILASARIVTFTGVGTIALLGDRVIILDLVVF
jgi:hypothetical protein